MGLKELMQKEKNSGYVVKYLDEYLSLMDTKDSDRALNVNAPSAMGTCLRSRYYSRTGEEPDSHSISPRSRRIFDNGTHTHIRLQEYLRKQGMLLMDEVPVLNKGYNIQGHTDGILRLATGELAILEIKSINSRGFSELKTAKMEHKSQGLVYAFCIESRRKYLHQTYENWGKFEVRASARKAYYKDFYNYLEDGSKFTKIQKVNFQVNLCMQLDELLMKEKNPLTKVIFLYENKDTQDLKEFMVDMTLSQSQKTLEVILNECADLNDYVERKELPPREGKSKNDGVCRWCNYKNACWIV